MDYPFYYSGKRSGTLSVSQSGVYTLFRVNAENIGEKMLRVSVYGDGKEYCLGVAEVRERKLYFEKKLSRNCMKGLPQNIEYAAQSGEKSEKDLLKKTQDNGSAWKRRADGSLISNDGISSIIALPAELRGNTGKDRIKIINGKAYMLFRY